MRTLSRDAYVQLFDEDLEWLLQQPRTLERMHIEHILRWLRDNYDAVRTNDVSEFDPSKDGQPHPMSWQTPRGHVGDADSLNLDVSAEHARALHRVVRAMHDGHCPKCGYLGPAEVFMKDAKHDWRNGSNPPVCPIPNDPDDGWHECPVCHFAITESQARAALMAFRPHLQKSLEVFEGWRSAVVI